MVAQELHVAQQNGQKLAEANHEKHIKGKVANLLDVSHEFVNIESTM